MSDDRYSRNEGLLGNVGQQQIAATTVGIVGYGGIGSVIGTLVAYLGVVQFRVVEFDVVEWSNLNRLFGATPDDIGRPKGLIATRSIEGVQPEGDVKVAYARFSEPNAQALLTDVDLVYGCVDRDSARVEMLRWASERGIPYIDAATDVLPQPDGSVIYGGRVVVSSGEGCLSCLDQLDQDELARARMTADQLAAHAKIYGVDVAALDRTGPSVVSINGVVGALAVTEFMVLVTGLRKPNRVLTYRGEKGGVTIDRSDPTPGCPYCTEYRDAHRRDPG